MKRFFILILLCLVVFSCTDALLKDGNDSGKSSNNSNMDNSGDEDVKYGVKGVVWADEGENKTGIPDAEITFTSEDDKVIKNIKTNESGGYRIELPKGNYKITVKHNDYQAVIFKKYYEVKEFSYDNILDIYMVSNKIISGFKGAVYEKYETSKKEKLLKDAVITFYNEEAGIKKRVITDEYGVYKIDLPFGRYNVEVKSEGYHVYHNNEYDYAVKEDGYQELNFFLKPLKEVSGLKGMIYGVDKDENSKHIIKNAKISFINKDKKIEKTIIADSSGRYKLDLPYGKYKVLISFYNYQTLYTDNEYIIVENKGHKIIDFVLKKIKGNTGLQGGVWERLDDGKIGQTLSCAKIVFFKKDGKGTVKTIIYSDQNGRYRVILPEGKYQVHVFHKDYKPYILNKGYIIVRNGRYQTSNYFLYKKNKNK